jgi:hypothetical protein
MNAWYIGSKIVEFTFHINPYKIHKNCSNVQTKSIKIVQIIIFLYVIFVIFN